VTERRLDDDAAAAAARFRAEVLMFPSSPPGVSLCLTRTDVGTPSKTLPLTCNCLAVSQSVSQSVATGLLPPFHPTRVECVSIDESDTTHSGVRLDHRADAAQL